MNEPRLVDVGLRLASQLNGAVDAVQTQAAPIMVRPREALWNPSHLRFACELGTTFQWRVR